MWENSSRTAWVAGVAHAAAESPETRVLVLVEATHGPAMAAAVGWPLLLPERVGPVPGRAVATAVWAAGQRPVPADVLVDARGWGAIDLAGFPPRGAGPVALVDAGVAGADGERRTARRLAEYRTRGWSVSAPRE